MTDFRGFIAVDVKAFPKLVEFENEVRKSGANIKLVDLKNIHITLKFLGNTDETLTDKIENAIKESVEEIDPFEIQLIGTGVFPNMNYMKVLWVGIKNSEILAQIAKTIDDKLSSLGYEKEKRKFSAHLTIARVKSAKNKEKLHETIEKFKEIEFGKLKVQSIKLKKSELTPKGPIYTTLREIII